MWRTSRPTKKFLGLKPILKTGVVKWLQKCRKFITVFWMPKHAWISARFGTHVWPGNTPRPLFWFGSIQNGHGKMAAKVQKMRLFSVVTAFSVPNRAWISTRLQLPVMTSLGTGWFQTSKNKRYSCHALRPYTAQRLVRFAQCLANGLWTCRNTPEASPSTNP